MVADRGASLPVADPRADTSLRAGFSGFHTGKAGGGAAPGPGEPAVEGWPWAPGGRPVAALGGGAAARSWPLPAGAVRLAHGFWDRRVRVNAARSIAAGLAQLESAGTLENLELAAGTAQGAYHGRLPFLDTDVFKWLEAVSWQLQQGEGGCWSAEEARAWSAKADDVIALVAAAQAPDGYLNSYVTVVRAGERWSDLAMGHELYCAGHLIQAGIAHRRATGRDNLFGVAVRFADLIVEEFREGGRQVGYCGHPEVETALVELYRETGRRAYLDLAARFVDLRGQGMLGDRPFGRRYFQDLTPVRETREVHGHAVRALYLATGVTDLYLETGEASLLEVLRAQWDDLLGGKTYITGGTGARHREEAFGDAFELPADRAYTETCAAIALMQWSWRMLLATGEARYADVFERVLYNGFLAGVSLDGERFFYVNPLQVRPDSTIGPQGRQTWFSCACCPPNVMRTFASLAHYLATGDADGLQVQQYAAGSIRVSAGTSHGTMGVEIATEYPFDGRVRLAVPPDCAGEWTLSLRIPAWATGAARVEIDGALLPDTESDGYVRLRRRWRGGEVIVLDLPLDARLTVPDARVDAVRDCAALERGPLVYCVEQRDQELAVDEVQLVGIGDELRPTRIADEIVPGLALAVRRLPPRAAGPDGWPYRTLDERKSVDGAHPGAALTAVPYYAWANRGWGAMRVWIPLDSASPQP